MEAKLAVKVATGLVEWHDKCVNNKQSFQTFSTWLSQLFEQCFKKRGSVHLRREKMWREYHQIRTSDTFTSQWKTFLESAGQVDTPTFYQHVTHEFFKDMIKKKHQIELSESETDQPMTLQEKNVLRYVAGHVCRKVQHQLSKSKVPEREDMVLFIVDLSGDESDEREGTEQWLNAIDRGGLWHVNDDTFTVFCIVEEEARQHFKKENADCIHAGSKQILIERILCNEELLFFWSMLASRVDDDIGRKVLDMLVRLYITIRGYSFASSCLELYKQATQKKLQKSKALRREIQQASSKEKTEMSLDDLIKEEMGV